MTFHWGIERDLKSESLEKRMIKSQKPFSCIFTTKEAAKKYIADIFQNAN